MRGLFTIVGLLVTLAVVGLLVKRQMAPLSASGTTPGVSGQTQNTPAQSQHIQAQVKQSLDAALQTPRAIPDDK